MNQAEAVELERLLGMLHQEKQDGIAMPDRVFNAALKIFPQVAVEAVIGRRLMDGSRSGQLEVYLIQRPQTAPCHQGHWHSPGTFLWARERVSEAMRRLSKRELGTAKITNWQQVQIQNNNLEPRGHTVSWIFCCEIQGEPTGGQWFPINRLPTPMVDHHPDLISIGTRPLLTEPFFLRANE